ncbi:alpha-1,2-mannosyltransferase [Nocardioides thalensis]|uniref:Alpha-1,2-mannosyltransferase n=1 Tax=Nocardioides thalensis TaxID=1914755 RepID=A0A853C156_9ACTN|nr:hypothetical protein [Nocardioides thalensis]NYJ01960.1 alpha-1,2-mannosyltransferase [Nocardioides thalensis]
MSGWRLPLALFAVVATTYLATISADPSPDVYSADFAAAHIARTGDPVPDISEFPALDDNIIRETWIVETADGREAIGRAPGVIAASVPAYFVMRPDGLSAIPGGVTAALLTAGSVTLLFLTLRRRAGTRLALVAAGLLGLGTPMWSVAADGMWPHTLTAFGIVGMAWAASRDDDAWWQWWVVGLFGGVVLWGRLHAALICAVVGVGVALARRRPAVAVRVGLASGAMLGLMSVWTRWMYGSWDPSSGYRSGDFTGGVADRLTDWVNFSGFWVAPDRGLLIWTPVLLVMAVPLARAWRGLPDWSRALLVGGVLYLLAQGLLVRFSGGDAFYGYRTSLELVVCATPALALSAGEMRRVARALFVPAALLQLALIAPGAITDNLGLPVAEVWHENAFVGGALHRPVVTLVPAGAVLLLGLMMLVVDRRVGRSLPSAPAESAEVRSPGLP